jgi:hypothetical protein
MNDSIKELALTNNQMVGHYSIYSNEQVPVILDIETSNPVFEDFKDIIIFADTVLANLTETKFNDIKKEIAKELTTAAYSESSYKPTLQDERNLEAELKLKRISFFPEDVISIVFEAKKEYPTMLIYCQLNEDLGVEDVIVE